MNEAVPVEALWQVEHSKGLTMTTVMYAVEGMMCDSCMSAVEAKVKSISGVTVVAMDRCGRENPVRLTIGPGHDVACFWDPATGKERHA